VNSSSSRILIVVNVFRPDLGGGILFSDLCDGLHERGFQIHVKCAFPYYPQWKDTTGKNGLQIAIDKSQGFPIERHGLFIPNNPNSLIQRLLYEASFFLSLARRLPKRNEYDAILVFSPLIGSVAYAVLASNRSKAPIWLNVQDLSAQAAAAGGIAGGGFVSRMLLRVQNALFRRCDFWSTISAPMVDTLRTIPGAPSTVALVPNWLHTSLAIQIDQCARGTLGTGHTAAASQKPPSLAVGDSSPSPTIALLYSGNLGGKQNLLAFCRYLHALACPFTFVIQAEGAQLPSLQAWVAGIDDERFVLRGLSDEAGLATAFSKADFYVITEKPGAGNSFIPSKLIPGISSGTPILAICDADGPLGEEVNAFEMGTQITWDHLSEVEALFNKVATNPNHLANWKQNAISRSAFYNRTSGIDRCVKVLKVVMSMKKEST